MTSVSATALRRDLYNIIANVNAESRPVTITNSRGKGAVLIGEDEWAAIEETLYLMSVPGMAESLLEASAEPDEGFGTETELEW